MYEQNIDRKPIQIDNNCDYNDFLLFFFLGGGIGVEFYCNQFLRPYLESLIKAEPFRLSI